MGKSLINHGTCSIETNDGWDVVSLRYPPNWMASLIDDNWMDGTREIRNMLNVILYIYILYIYMYIHIYIYI